MRSRWFGVIVAVLAAAVSVWAYPQLPPTVATHWNLRGTPDGFSSRTLAVAIMPAVMLVMAGVFRVLPRLDPRGENYAKFIGTYWLIANSVIVFLLIAHGLILATGLGYAVKIDRLMPIGVGVLFIILGNFLTRVEPNWFVGIRTPWTMSSDTVWRKTHRTGGWLMVAGGFVIAACAFLPHGAFLPLFIAAILIMVVIPIVQSYILWKREKHDRS